ncbi:MAG TPA: hypothetical protein VNJ53_04740, partial [Gaiellaceae bacterium]|nr:hypothetical protein [Gaiellaceae bacterium]
MRKLLTWLVVSLGIAALVRRLRRRSAGAPAVGTAEAPPPAAQEDDDPADELRRKLAESREETGVAAEEP